MSASNSYPHGYAEVVICACSGWANGRRVGPLGSRPRRRRDL